MSSQDLTSAIAVVTGAGGGIGQAIARRLAYNGWRVAVADVDIDAARSVATSIGSTALGVHLDVRSWESVEAAASRVEAEFGAAHALVNNAGITRVARSEDLPREWWDEIVDVNLSGTWRCAQVWGAKMLARGNGAIVNLGSAYSEIGAPGRVAYAATKSGVLGLTRVLATEWASRGVRVNTVEPGYVDTEMMQVAVRSGAADLAQLVGRIPAGRLGTTDEIAAVVAFLLSEDASYVNGAALRIDGGHLAYGGIAAVEAVVPHP